jgi:hypothetical protein
MDEEQSLGFARRGSKLKGCAFLGFLGNCLEEPDRTSNNVAF